MSQAFTHSQLHVSHQCCGCWICCPSLLVSLLLSAVCWVQRPQYDDPIPIGVGIHKSCSFLNMYTCRVYGVYHLLFPFPTTGQFCDTFVPRCHSSSQGHVDGTRSSNLSVNLAVLLCVSSLQTREETVLETCEDGWVRIWFVDQCWSVQCILCLQ